MPPPVEMRRVVQRLDHFLGRLLRGEASPLIAAGIVRMLRVAKVGLCLFVPVLCARGHKDGVLADSSEMGRCSQTTCSSIVEPVRSHRLQSHVLHPDGNPTGWSSAGNTLIGCVSASPSLASLGAAPISAASWLSFRPVCRSEYRTYA